VNGRSRAQKTSGHIAVVDYVAIELRRSRLGRRSLVGHAKLGRPFRAHDLGGGGVGPKQCADGVASKVRLVLKLTTWPTGVNNSCRAAAGVWAAHSLFAGFACARAASRAFLHVRISGLRLPCHRGSRRPRSSGIAMLAHAKSARCPFVVAGRGIAAFGFRFPPHDWGAGGRREPEGPRRQGERKAVVPLAANPMGPAG